MLADDLDETRATIRRKRPPARVLERGNRVQERRSLDAPPELGVERVGIDSLVVHLEPHDLDSLARQDLQRTVVARRLDQHPAGHSRELLRGVEDEALEAADGEDDALRGRLRVAPQPIRGAGHIPRQGRRRRPGRRRSAPRRARSPRAPEPVRVRARVRLARRKSAPGTRLRDYAKDYARAISATSCAASVGVVPTRTPRASSASFFACAVPAEPEMIAPAWPIVFPGGAVKPAM